MKGENCLYKRGDKVIIVNSIGSIVTHEVGIVHKVNKRGVWLDGGGDDLIGPFDELTGEWENNETTPGASMKIQITKETARRLFAKLVKSISINPRCTGQ